jgi:trehalose 6-phosphate phosphatase
VIGELARRFAKVAIVSGRPVAFLVEHLQLDKSQIEIFGQYGLEHRLTDGKIVGPAQRERYAAAVDAALAEARGRAARGVIVEAKGIALTLHWRRAPEARQASIALGRELADRYGFYVREGKMAIELVPDQEQDKGAAIRSIFSELSMGCVLGDDVGDIPAFRAAREMERDRGFEVVLVVATSSEVPPELLELADVRVVGPRGAIAFLQALVGASV